MANSIQHGFWGNGTVDGIQDYADALAGGSIPGDGTTPLGQLKYYQYRLGRPYDFFRWRQAQGFQENGKVNPSLADYPTAKYLLGQTVPGHTVGVGVQGTIICLEYTWRTTNPKTGITAASIINGNFDFGPRARMVAGTSQNGSNADGAARWAARPRKFTAPTFGVSYGARSYNRDAASPTDFPNNDAWLTSFNRNSVRSGSPGSYSITPGTISLEAGTDECYSLWEMGLDILYLTSLYPNAMFMLDHVLEVNINHGANELNDIPQDTNPDTTLNRANYSDAVLHIISFLEAMGIRNVMNHIGLAGPSFYNGGAAGNNSADPWWGNILAQEKNDTAYGAINTAYARNRTWVQLAGRDMYSGQNGAVAYRSPGDLVNSIVSWAHRFDKYCDIFTTGITPWMDTGTPATGNQHATYPKNGNLRQGGASVDGDNFFSAFRRVGDVEMGVASPRLWGVCYQIGFESQDPHNDYNPESDSAATNRGTRANPLPAPPITSGNVYWDSSGGYTPTTLPPVGARKGWRAFWDWLNAPNWKGGAPLYLPSGTVDGGGTAVTGTAALHGGGTLSGVGVKSVNPGQADNRHLPRKNFRLRSE